MKSTNNNNADYYIKITENGPYLVYGLPSIDEDIIAQDSDGDAWFYRKGKTFNCDTNPYALCRCGKSDNKPFCNGNHAKTKWDGRETATKDSYLNKARVIKSEHFTLYDNKKLCSYARFCDAYGSVWNLVRQDYNTGNQKVIEHQVAHCPSGRLVLFDNKTQNFYEPNTHADISIIEDSIFKISGPIWVRGGIRIESSDGSSYEIRNRVTLCRCGHSKNKPFCDSTHVFAQFDDDLMTDSYEETIMENEVEVF